MGLQSSRIIWGKTKLPGTNLLTPITLYDDSNTVYISGNYAIYSASSGSVSPDYRLYLCGAAETGGEFEPDDWKEQKGVKNWALEGHRAYNVNAKVIKELHGVEYTYTDEEGHEQTITLDGVYLFKCITKTPPDHAWHQECWELVFQEVGLAYIARDHKEVYYNGKFHKAMYFMPPEAQDETDLEIIDFNEEWRYHFGDLMIYNKYNTEKGNKCYKYVNHIPSSGTYDDSNWEIQNNPDNQPIAEYEANIAYPKNYRCIKRQIIIYEQVICEYDGYHLKYNTSKYCIYQIDKDDYLQREIDAGERLYPNWYRDLIIAGETIYGLFRAKSTAGNGDGYFNPNKWDLVNYRDGHYVLQWIPVNNGDPYTVGDERIFYFPNEDGSSSSIMGLNRCIKDHITPTTMNCPTNSEYWETIDQNIESMDSYRVFKALRDISAENNTHFDPNNWAVCTQSMKIDDELYGIIWEKYGNPGDGGIPFYAPILVEGKPQNTWDAQYHRYTRLDYFYYSTGGQILLNGPVLYDTYDSGSYTGDYKSLLISTGIYIYGMYQLFNKTVLVGHFNEWKHHDDVEIPNGGSPVCFYQSGFLYSSPIGIGKFTADMNICANRGYIYTNDGNEEYYQAYQQQVSGFVLFKYRIDTDNYILKAVDSDGNLETVDTARYEDSINYTFITNLNGTKLYTIKEVSEDTVTTVDQTIYNHLVRYRCYLITVDSLTRTEISLFDISYSYNNTNSRPEGALFSFNVIWLDQAYLYFSFQRTEDYAYVPSEYDHYYKLNLLDGTKTTTSIKMFFTVPYYGGTNFALEGNEYEEVEIVVSGILRNEIPVQSSTAYRINVIPTLHVHNAYCGSGGGPKSPQGIFGGIMATDQRRGDAYSWNVAIPYFPNITTNIGCFAWMGGHNIAGDGPFYGGPDNPEFDGHWGW